MAWHAAAEVLSCGYAKSLFIDPIADRRKLILPNSEIRATASHLNYFGLSAASYIDGDPP